MGKKENNRTRILIIDDHPLFREGLKTVLAQDSAFEVVGEAGNAQDGLEASRKFEPAMLTSALKKGLL